MAVRERDQLGEKLSGELTQAAIEIVARRIATLTPEELVDLRELIEEIERADATSEEKEAAAKGLAELLNKAHQPTPVVKEVGATTSRTERLQRWTDYVSKKIKDLRRQAGWTQADLAERSGLPQSHISRIETGRHSPSGQTIDRIAAAFGVKPAVIDLHRD